MDKRDSFIQRKQVNNGIPKFDPGKMALNKGFLSPINVDTASFTSTPSYDMSNAVNALNKSIFPTNITKATQTGSSIAGVLGNYTTQSAANAANVAAANALNTAKAGTISADIIKGGGEQLAKAVGDAGGTVTKTGLNTLGKVTAGLGTAMSAFNTYNDIINASNHLNSSDMLAMSGRATQSKNGGLYDILTGFNSNQVMDYTKAQTTSNQINMLTDATSLGASIGSFGGLLGTAIGAGAGFLVGGIADLLGFGNNEDEVREEIRNTNRAITGYNNQSESVGSSRGMRDSFYSADKGKNLSHFVNGKPVTFNSSKEDNKKVLGLASPDETWLNTEAPLMEKVGYFGSPDPKVKDRRVDNVKLYGDIDPVRIAGHDEDSKINNKYIATLARPAGKEAERIKEEYNKTTDPNKKAQLEDRMRFLDKKVGALLDMLEDMQNRDNMKHQLNYKRINGLRKFAEGKNVPKFDNAKTFSDYANPALGMFTRLLPDFVEKRMVDSLSPYAYDTYVPYSGYNPIRQVVDYSQQIAKADKAAREGVYHVMQAGNLNSAQKQALLLSNNYSNRDAVNAILKSQSDEQNKRDLDYLNQKMNIGFKNQQYANSARESWANRYAQAVGAKQRWQVGNLKNFATSINQSMQDWSTDWFRRGLLNLWDRDSDPINTNNSKSSLSDSVVFTNKGAVSNGNVLPYAINPDLIPESIYNTYYAVPNQQSVLDRYNFKNINTSDSGPRYLGNGKFYWGY